MTMKLAKKPSAKRPTRKKPVSDMVSLVLRKPTDEMALRDLAEKLNGRPVPGLRMTEAEFEAWSDEDVNAEWVDGEVVLMSAMSLEQADLFTWLIRLVGGFVEDRGVGKVLGSEFSIRLGRLRRRRNPDVLVVLNHRLPQLRATCLEGPPDIAFEIVSPESVVRDWRDKYEEYQAAGVREYWVIDPTTKRFEAYALRGKKYQQITEDDDGRIVSRVLKGFYLRAVWLWKQPLPRVTAVLRELSR